MPIPSIIILDGPSGVGKSSIAHALQEALLPDVWLSFAMDTILYTLPSSVLERCNQSNDWSAIDPSVFTGAVDCLRALADAGNRVIFDTTLSTPKLAKDLLDAVGELAITTVGVQCAWEEIERRTIARGDRTIEEARLGFDSAPKYLDYDMMIDTTTLSPSDAANQIALGVSKA